MRTRIKEWNGAIAVVNEFNPPSREHSLLMQQVQKLAEDTGYDVHIFISNSPRCILPASLREQTVKKMYKGVTHQLSYKSEKQQIEESIQCLYKEGYESFIAVTGVDRVPLMEEAGYRVVTTGRLDPDNDMFSVLASPSLRKFAAREDFKSFSKGIDSYDSGIATLLYESLRGENRILEQIPPTAQPQPPQRPQPQPQQVQKGPILLLTALNANPPVKGHGELIKEALTKDQEFQQQLARILPNTVKQGWNGKTVSKIYLRPAISKTEAPLPGEVRGDFLVELYGGEGVATTPLNLSDKAFIYDQMTSIVKSIQEASNIEQPAGVILFAPKGQVQAIQALIKDQKGLNALDGGQIPIYPLKGNDVDAPDTAILTTASKIAEASRITKGEKAPEKPEEAKGEKIEVTLGDLIACRLIIALDQVTLGKIDPKGGKGASDYLKNLFNAIPRGDVELMKAFLKGTGIGDLIDVGKDLAKLGKAILGGKDKNKPKPKNPEQVKKQQEELQKWLTKFEKLGYNLFTMVKQSDYKTFKGKLDLAD
jgi:hypothetical protein